MAPCLFVTKSGLPSGGLRKKEEIRDYAISNHATESTGAKGTGNWKRQIYTADTETIETEFSLRLSVVGKHMANRAIAHRMWHARQY